MPQQTLDAVPIWLLFVAVAALSGVALESGYRFGRWRRARTADEKEAPVGAMVASVLGLYAFLLAFTFGLAATRFEARRMAVLNEANAVGTAYLRTRLLPEPQRAESARLLREYVDVRVAGVREGRIEETVRRSEEIHGQLWDQAVLAAESKPTPVTVAYVQALNQVIELHGVRVQAGVRSRVPTSIWFGLFALGALATACVGYQSGIAATRRSPAMAGLVLAFTGVLFLIADLDRSREGFLTVDQQALVDVQASMNKDVR